MNILALAPHLNPTAGWGTIPANVLPELSENHDLRVLVSEETDPEFSNRYDFEVEPILPEPLETYHPVRVFQTAYHLRKELSGDIDLIHSFIAYPYLPIAVTASLGKNIPITATALGTYAIRPFGERFQRPLLTQAYKRADHVFCISDYTSARINGETGGVNSSVNPLGINLEQFSARDITDENYILSVGAIKRRKSQDVLVEAFAEIASDFPSIDLKIAGPVHEEPVSDRIQSLIQQHDLGDRVELLGMVDDQDRLQDLYSKCTFFALTPTEVDDNMEGFGLVYLEAGAFEKASVATRSGGVPTAVEDGVTGLLAEERDVSGIAAAMRRLLKDNDERRKMGKKARERAERLTWSAHVESMETVWSEILP